jgi:peptidoglycan hydrolase-like protein with peptidoglycan-binding domain
LPLRNSRWIRILILACAALLLAGSLAAAPAEPTRKSNKPTSSRTGKKSSRHNAARRGSWRSRGQKGIDGARAREIQQALIREGYLDGKASGQWDARSKDAMARYQADHGWQTRTVPDARALIKLGLGPATAGPASGESPAAPSAAPAGGEKSPSGARQD